MGVALLHPSLGEMIVILLYAFVITIVNYNLCRIFISGSGDLYRLYMHFKYIVQRCVKLGFIDMPLLIGSIR